MGNSKSKDESVISEIREAFLKKLDESIKSNDDYFFVNPSVLWENLHPSNRFSIQTFPRDHQFLSEITFNHQKFQDVHPKLKDSRDRVAIKAMRVLLDFDHASWSDFFLPEDEREEKRYNKIIKQYKQRALELKEHFQTPLDLWTSTTNNSITTNITELRTYCSKIIFLNQTLVVIDFDENVSRQKVAEKALKFFFDISLPFKQQTTQVIQKTNLDTEIKNPERVTKSELCKSQTPQLIQKIKSDTVKENPENDRLKFTPVSIWDSITAGQYPIDTYVISMTREYRSDINFCGILTQAYDLDYQKSRHIVAVFALEKFFKVSFPQWNIYKKLTPIDKKKEEKEQLEKQQKEREETISMYKASLQGNISIQR
uniref:CSON005511 protein n=1 Tax=Culicoides sonorensis TaxID=179676 RepID=A0A336MX54_CULSO